MDKKQIWLTVVISLVVALIVAWIVVAASGPFLGPATKSTAEINANRCQADSICETNSLLVGPVAKIDTTEQYLRFVKGPTLVGGMSLDSNAKLKIDSLTGNATAYACTDNNGVLYRSEISCKNDSITNYLRNCQNRGRRSIWNGSQDVISGDLICPTNTRCSLAQMTTYFDSDGDGIEPGELLTSFMDCTTRVASAGEAHYVAISVICCPN